MKSLLSFYFDATKIILINMIANEKERIINHYFLKI